MFFKKTVYSWGSLLGKETLATVRVVLLLSYGHAPGVLLLSLGRTGKPCPPPVLLVSSSYDILAMIAMGCSGLVQALSLSRSFPFLHRPVRVFVWL